MSDIDLRRSFLSVPEAAEIPGISRSLAYQLVRKGDLPAQRVGGRILIPMWAIDRLRAEPQVLFAEGALAAGLPPAIVRYERRTRPSSRRPVTTESSHTPGRTSRLEPCPGVPRPWRSAVGGASALAGLVLTMARCSTRTQAVTPQVRMTRQPSGTSPLASSHATRRVVVRRPPTRTWPIPDRSTDRPVHRWCSPERSTLASKRRATSLGVRQEPHDKAARLDFTDRPHTSDLLFCGAPPGIRTQNLWIKSPLLCR